MNLDHGEIPKKQGEFAMISEKIEENQNESIKEEGINESSHLASTGALCLAMFCHTYLLMSVFPYAGFMAIYLIPGLSSETAGSYAGLISSCYMAGRAVCSFTWGAAADTIGRKPVLYLSFLLSSLCSIWFGLSSSIEIAFLSRFMMGMMNGLVLVVKTAVSEIARGDEKLEARGMGMVMGMWGWGYLIGPVISGLVSEPVKQYPKSEIVQYFEPFFSKYPFVLPNLISVLLCLTGSILVFLFVDETLPEEKRQSISSIFKKYVDNLKMRIQRKKRYEGTLSENETLPLQCRNGKSHSIETNSMHENEVENHRMKKKKKPSSTSSSKLSVWSKESTRHHLIGYWICSFSNIMLDEAFPLFCIAKKGGLNLTETGIGKILSGAGAIFIIGQYFSFTLLVSRFGIYKTLLISSIFATPVTIFMPFSLYLNRLQTETNSLSWLAYIFLISIYACKNIGINVLVSSITIATNRTVSADQRASMNGISMLGGSIVKALGPACAGFLISFLLGGNTVAPVAGSIILYGIISCIGIFCIFFTSLVLHKHHEVEE